MSFLTDLLGKIPAARRAQLARPPFGVLKDLLLGRSQKPSRILSPLAQPQPRLGPQPMIGPQTVSEPRRAPPQMPAQAPAQTTTPEQLGKFWGGVVTRQGGFPMQEHIPALIETEEEYDLKGFAKVAALLSQIESSGGYNMPEGSNNPYGLLTSGHGSPAQQFESIPAATRRLAEEFTRPEGFYKIPRGTELTLPYVKENIAPRYNVEGGGYWPTFADWWEELE